MGEILDEAQDQTEKSRMMLAADKLKKQFGGDHVITLVEDLMHSLSSHKGETVDQYQARIGQNLAVPVKVGGKDYGEMTVAEARKNFDMASAHAKKLVEDQATLDNNLKNAKSTATEKMDAQNRVNEDLENINGEIKIAQNDPKTRHGGGGRSATERERVGVGAPQVANLQKQTLDVTKMQLIEARKLNTQMDLLIKSGRGNNDLNNF